MKGIFLFSKKKTPRFGGETVGETDGQKFPPQEIFGEGIGAEKWSENRLQKLIGETVVVNGTTVFLRVVCGRLYIPFKILTGEFWWRNGGRNGLKSKGGFVEKMS